MDGGLCAAPLQSEHRSRTKSSRASFGACVNPRGEFPMQWQTPTAIDFRFGFEITLYVANR